jgi:hypothetical protein
MGDMIDFVKLKQDEAVGQMIAALVLNLSLHIGGIILIGLGSNFYIAFGLGAFALFLKGGK